LNTWPSTKPASMEATFGDAVPFAGAKIWDDSGATPVPVTGLAGMVGDVLPAYNWDGNSWRVKIPGTAGTAYLAKIYAFTDNTYTTTVGDEPEGSESFIFQDFSAGGGSSAEEVILVDDDTEEPVVLVSEDPEDIILVEECDD
jgi:hypothetical protein